MGPGQMIPRTNGSGKNGSQDKRVSGQIGPGQMGLLQILFEQYIQI